MHVRKRAMRLLSAVALVTFALPLASATVVPSASAQTASNIPPASITGAGSATNFNPATGADEGPVAFNPIGSEAGAAFTCGAATTTGTSAVAPGCYGVTAAVTDITTGSASTFDSAVCGGIAAPGGSGTVNCGTVRSPICPVGTSAATATANPAAAPCTATTGGTTTATASNQVVVTFNPGAPHAYTVEFTGFIPTDAAGACPAGTTLTTVTGLPSTITPPTVATTSACRFAVEVQKKYVEVTSIVVTPVGTCGGSLTFAEGLKSFFGPACVATITVSGTVILKTGVNCSNGSEPATGSAAPAEFGPSATYSCDANGVLSVVGVTGPGNTSLPGVTLGPGATGVGSFVTVGTLGGLCAGSTSGGTPSPIVTTGSGATATLCPTGPGTATFQVCLVGPDGTPSTLPNNQPPLCSNTITFTFTLNTARVVPQVRWAGEKIELTKCFGLGLAGYPVEFTLQSNSDTLGATLIPATLASATSTPTQNTFWTVTDARGCATVLGLASGEGVMNVDAAIFNTSTAGTAVGSPLVNEHAFEVFYLKFDHLDLENIKFQTYNTAQALTPYLGFLTNTPALNGASLANATFTLPGPPGTGSPAGGNTFAVPLCTPDFVRAMVHGYFEYPGDPSGRPAAQVAIPGAAAGSAGSYVLPAGRWVLPEDWPLLATFAGTGTDITPSSILAWDLNSGWVFNPTGEKPVICGLAAGVIGTSGLLLANNASISSTTSSNAPQASVFGNIPVGAKSSAGAADVGPCFGQSGGQSGSTYYATAPGSLTTADAAAYAAHTGFDCLGGFTAGFGPFDPTRACTNPFPLPYSPAGSSVIGINAANCGSAANAPCLVPTNPDSTYLPNGTLNEWDAPMPPAQISFGITSGIGFLGEVNKTGLYQVRFNAGAASSTGTCPTGYTLVSATNDCQLELDPNPFYAEAIPASPLIPPVDNNGGYLFNSWNFTAGTTTIVRSTAPFATAPAGGFVAGQSTTFTYALPNGISPCPTFSSNPGATTGNCTLAGGTNVAPAILSTTGTESIVVADCSGFMTGEPVEIYNNTVATGATIGTTTTGITAVLPSPRTVGGVSFPNACELQFAAGTLEAAGLSAANSAAGAITVIGTYFGLPVPGAGAFSVGQPLTIGTGTTTADTTVAALDTTNNIVYVNGAEAIAARLSNCLLSRTPAGSGTTGTAAFGSCEPAAVVAPGTVINSGPVGATSGAEPSSLYPFWQWLPAAPSATATPTQATVYSDNHGEAVVTLNTAVQSQIAPSSTGTCPAPYVPVAFNGGAPTTCLLPLAALGGSSFPNGTLTNVAAALAAFSASNPGCIQTFASGTSATLTGVLTGANGPAAGQICVNSLGGVEFGASAFLGTTTVQAVADYPYIREHAQIASASLTKVWTSAFAKTLNVSAGTPAPAGTTSYTVTITATDVCGNPITGEPIEVFALGAPGSVVLAPVSVGGVLNASQTSATVLVNKTGANAGTATLSLEVLNSGVGTSGLVIKAVFPFEQIERFFTVIPGSAGNTSTTVVFPPGWQQVGGPAGTNFSTVEALFSYDTASGQYANATSAAGNVSSAAPSCTGYWGYFAAAMAVNIPNTSHTGDTAACTLKAGYNLVGNPFATPARLPSGVTAFHWNGTSYDTVGVIGTGQSVWVFNDGTLNTLTLTAS